jgi:hypothetical protein
MKMVGCQPYAPAAFTPRMNLVLILEAESTPGHMELSDATKKKNPATPGIFFFIRNSMFRLQGKYQHEYL